ncbi:MAG: ribbon-helix-helix protein, CopG family [Chloroflexi bacterium]|nr:ribbon-helix-helix protein, CopG family [Chloroflexota bacterium]
MPPLNERLEVRLPTQTLQMLREVARRRGISIGQLVREAIDLLLEQDRQARLHAAEDLFQIEAPVADWAVMKKEIEEAHMGAGLP